MKVVYVAGKFTGLNTWDTARHVRSAETIGLEVARAGAMPLIPHAITHNFHGLLVEFWYEGTMELLRRCDAVVTVPGWEDSKGAKAEVAWATEHQLPVFHRIEDLKVWLKET